MRSIAAAHLTRLPPTMPPGSASGPYAPFANARNAGRPCACRLESALRRTFGNHSRSSSPLPGARPTLPITGWPSHAGLPEPHILPSFSSPAATANLPPRSEVHNAGRRRRAHRSRQPCRSRSLVPSVGNCDQQPAGYANRSLMPAPKVVVVARFEVPTKPMLRGRPEHKIQHDFAAE